MIPIITVIVPLHNEEKFIDRLMQSLQVQTHRRLSSQGLRFALRTPPLAAHIRHSAPCGAAGVLNSTLFLKEKKALFLCVLFCDGNRSVPAWGRETPCSYALC